MKTSQPVAGVLPAQRSYSRGFSLLEVLVALLVLSIGLLGLAALQTVGLKFNTQSYQRTQAVLNAYDIIDRMRANPAAVAAGSYDNIAISDPIPTPTDCGSSNCSSAQMATYDIAQWKTALASLLAAGKGAICRGSFNISLTTCTAGAGNQFQIGVEWKENDIAMHLTVESQL
jgi:type IV pilus assembly protein PilV